MKIKIDDIDYLHSNQILQNLEVGIHNQEQKKQVDVWMEEWRRQVQESKLKEKRDLRKKKLENITKNKD